MNTKLCKGCGQTKSIDCFYQNGFYYRTICKDCESTKRKQWITNNPEKHDKRLQRRKQWMKDNPETYDKQKRENRRLRKIHRKELAFIINKEKEKGCSYCGYSQFVECLQFHHLDPSEKESEISKMLQETKNEKIILEEIKKCIVLCANCHHALHNGDIKI